MTRDIVEAIDNAIDDYLSADAMRWTPEPAEREPIGLAQPFDLSTIIRHDYAARYVGTHTYANFAEGWPRPFAGGIRATFTLADVDRAALDAIINGGRLTCENTDV